MKPTRIGAVVVTAIAVVFATMQFTTAATSPTYSACANKKTGSLRMIASNKSCKKTETRITWNQRGPQGDPGVAGVPGASGSDATQSILLTPRDFAIDSGISGNAHIDAMTHVNGTPTQGLVFEHVNSWDLKVEAQSAVPTGWSNVQYVRYTFYYWTAPGGTYNLVFNDAYQDIAEAPVLSDDTNLVVSGVATTDALEQVSVIRAFDPSKDFITVVFGRRKADPTSAQFILLGAKIEPYVQPSCLSAIKLRC